MSEPNKSEYKSADALSEAYFRLKDVGLPMDSGDYCMSNLLKMKHAIEIVRDFGQGLPNEVIGECEIRTSNSS
jgi:hypothetical protein